MGSEFDAGKAIAFLNVLHGKGTDDCLSDHAVVTFMDLRKVLEAGRVPSKPEIVMPPTKPCGCLEGHKCAADDTIRISRKVAEHFLKYWATMVAETKIDADKQMVREIRKAIGSDE